MPHPPTPPIALPPKTGGAAARAQQRIEDLCAAAIRALTGDPALHFRAHRLHHAERPVAASAPHLHPSPEHDDFGSFRGAADGLALRLRHSDAELHRGLRPTDTVERLLFELLEQFRVEALAPPDMPGMARNLRHRHEQWSLAFHHQGLTDTARGILLYTLAQVCRARVTGQPVIEATEDLIEATRMALVAHIGGDLPGLRRHRDDQRAYAVHALSVAQTVAELLRGGEDDADEDRGRAGRDDPRRNPLLMWLEPEGDGSGAIAGESGDPRELAASPQGYRAFTTAYDQELHAASLARPPVLKDYREQLDRRILAHGLNVARLARELQALLARPARDGWDSAQEEGRLDGRRLAQLVASPTERRLFRTDRQQPQSDCVVGFLVDCSGSMKQHAEMVAVLVDVFVRALEQAGVASEVLGFTTGAWGGGRPKRDWQRAGRPAQPGRLNETRHLVFKDADTPWRRARRDIAALLKADLFREGVDGEAVDWACRRMTARGEQRRILVVVSDGCPMDSATDLANDAQYLDRHLREVVARREAEGTIEVRGLGVGLDLSPYYRHSKALDLASLAGYGALREVLELIAAGVRR